MMTKKSRKGLVKDYDIYLDVSDTGFLIEELKEIIDKYDIDTPEGSASAIKALKDYMKSSEYDAQDVFGRLTSPSRKGAQSFATSGFNKTMNAVSGIANSKPVMNTLKKYTGTQDQRNQSVIEDYNKQQEKEARAKKAQEIKSMKGSRKGCLECKGSRPDNLYEIASGIVNNKRSLK